MFSGSRYQSAQIIGALSLVALALSGCIAMQAASAVTSTAINTVSAVGRAVTNTSNVVSRTVQRIPAAMMYNSAPRQVVVPLRSAPRAAQTTPRPVSRAAAQPAKQRAPSRRISKQRSEILEVLPPELLDQLNKDQIILQSMVQKEALESANDDIVFWELEGSAGTAFAEAPKQMGSFTCRAVVETIKLDDGTDEATESRATACKTENTSWTLSF